MLELLWREFWTLVKLAEPMLYDRGELSCSDPPWPESRLYDLEEMF